MVLEHIGMPQPGDCRVVFSASAEELEAAIQWAKGNDRTTVISIATHPCSWTPGDAWWDVGVPEVSARESVNQAYTEHLTGRQQQRVGF